MGRRSGSAVGRGKRGLADETRRAAPILEFSKVCMPGRVLEAGRRRVDHGLGQNHAPATQLLHHPAFEETGMWPTEGAFRFAPDEFGRHWGGGGSPEAHINSKFVLRPRVLATGYVKMETHPTSPGTVDLPSV